MIDPTFQPDRRRIVRTVTRPGFAQNRVSLVVALERSRELRRDPENLLYLQAELANELIHLQTTQRELKRKIAAEGAIPEEELVDSHEVAKALSFVIKQIADGIAWRSLDYDRGMVHELALAPQTGHMELESALAEVKQAATIVAELGSIVLLNDLTNFLRYGDLTCISQEFVDIVEVKGGAAAAKSGRATRQSQRIKSMLDFINRRERSVPGVSQRLLRLSTAPVSYLRELDSLISTARNAGSAYARLSDALAVDVFDVRVAADLGDPPANMFHNPFSQSRGRGSFTNLDRFGRFSPNVAPFSVFPLQAEHCVGLMTGELLLMTYINRGNVVRALRRRNLKVRVPTDEELNKLPTNLKPGEVKDYEFAAPIVVSNGFRAIQVSLGEIARLAHELLDEGSYAEAVVEILDIEIEKEELMYWSFEREAGLWD